MINRTNVDLLSRLYFDQFLISAEDETLPIMATLYILL